jgi:hypothetical protein
VFDKVSFNVTELVIYSLSLAWLSQERLTKKRKPFFGGQLKKE